MKISIGSRVVDGPWGGGNLFVKNLSNFLKENGHKVIYDLADSDIDLILLTDPRSRKESTSTYNHEDIYKYKKYVNKNVTVVQRINECDERKNTDYINEFYLEASKIAQKVVFVSSWLEGIYKKLGMPNEKTQVILSGSDSHVFNRQNSRPLIEGEKIRLLTHHWSSNRNKGFDTYELINKLIVTEKWKNKLDFTYIGNTSDKYDLSNTTIIEPLAGHELAEKIKEHHIYVTGSINEPSGNHHIEAAQCGLPILFINSGGIPEYCEGFGIGFDDNFEEKLEELINNYTDYKNELNTYPFNSELMCKEYLDLFTKLVENNKLVNEKVNLVNKYSFLLKQKFMKIVRDNLYFLIRKQISSIVKYSRSKNG